MSTPDHAVTNIDARLSQAASTITALSDELETYQQRDSEPIAITGMAVRLPGGANTPEKLWQLLEGGIDATTDFPQRRAQSSHWVDEDPDAPGKAYTTRGGFLTEDISLFEPSAFGISPREARGMDPQQRLALELAWEALEDAAVAPDNLAGSRTGVWVGASTTDYVRLRQAEASRGDVDAYQLMGEPSFIAGRISYTLGLQGPAQVIDTACSSSLVALHQACHSLRTSECDQALAGGVNLMLMPYGFVLMSKFKALAPDGRCKTFDASADGYARGEGGVMLTLKRASDAARSGDPIWGYVRGSAVNHDGRSSGISVPSPRAQQNVIATALQKANCSPLDLQYVEAHGTGTSLGDPIELSAIDRVLGEGRTPPSCDDDQLSPPLLVGSIKTNIGHLEPAAGIAGVAKVLVAMRHNQVPPHLHLNHPNPKAPWHRLRLQVPTAGCQWPETQHKCAGVSSFGVTGTNAHVILSGAEHTQPATASDDTDVMILSADSASSIATQAEAWAEQISTGRVSWPDACHTSRLGRARRKLATAVTDTAKNASDRLRQLSRDVPDDDSLIHRVHPATAGTAFLFTGQGSQHQGLGHSLPDHPRTRELLNDLNEAFRPHIDVDLDTLMYREVDIHDTKYTQPALFAFEYVMATTLIESGLTPDVLVGHSIGEIAAAAVAQAMTLPASAKLVARRGALMSQLPHTSGMVAVIASEHDTTPLLEPFTGVLDIAAINGPSSVVVSGDLSALAQLREVLEEHHIRTAPLHVSHGFHSPALDSMLDDFAQLCDEIEMSTPIYPVISNVTGRHWDERQEDSRYWVDHARSAVRYADAVQLASEDAHTFVEVGPQPTLIELGKSTVRRDTDLWIPCARRSSTSDTFTTAAAKLHARLARLDWTRLSRHSGARISGPTTAWVRDSYWFDVTARRNLDHSSRSIPGLGVQSAEAANSWIKTLDKPTAETLTFADIATAAAQSMVITRPGTCLEALTLTDIMIRPAAMYDTGRWTLSSEDADGVMCLRYDVCPITANPTLDSSWMNVARAHVNTTPRHFSAPEAHHETSRSTLPDRLRHAPALPALAQYIDQLAARVSCASVTVAAVKVNLGHKASTFSHDTCDGSTAVRLYDDNTVIAQATGIRVESSNAVNDSPVLHRVDWQQTTLELPPKSASVLLVGSPLPDHLHSALPDYVRDSTTDAGAIDAAAVWGQAQEHQLDTIVVSCRSNDDPDTVLQTNLVVTELLKRMAGTDCRVHLVTFGAIVATPDDNITDAFSRTLWGLGRVAAIEHSDNFGRCLDIGPRVGVTDLFDTLASASPEDAIALRHKSGRTSAWVPRLNVITERSFARPTSAPSRGTVIVTGAFGGIGRRVCQWLAASGVPSLILTSRSGCDTEDKKAFIQTLQTLGCHIETRAVDVADTTAIHSLVSDLVSSNHDVSGVVHAAGVSHPQDIIDITPHDFEKVWGPKVTGTAALLAATADLDLDLCVLFTSIASTWGSQHLASYAAANAYLDGIAEQRRSAGLPVTAIAWGPWELPSELFNDEVMAFLTSVGLLPLDPHASLGLLDTIIANGPQALVACAANWSRYTEVMTLRREQPLFDNVSSRESIDMAPSASLKDAWTTSATDHRDQVVTDHVRTVVADVMNLDVVAVPKGDLFASGLDSIMAMEIASRLTTDSGAHIGVRDLFERSTIEEWSSFVQHQLATDHDTPHSESANDRKTSENENPEHLAAEIALPDSLNNCAHTSALPPHVLLTGATGFIGVHLLRELLDAGCQITCIVRAANALVGASRLEQALQSHALGTSNLDRVTVLPGDLSDPDLGLDSQQWDDITNNVDVILHNGATVNFIHTFDQLRAANVTSLLTLLERTQHRATPLHYVSTYGVWGLPEEGVHTVTEGSSLLNAGRLVTGYAQTKWAADRLAQQAQAAGHRVTIHRPGRVVCDTQGRTVMLNHFTTRVLQACIELGVAPELDFELEITPVDYVTRAITALAIDDCEPTIVHLVNNRRMPFKAVIETLKDLGHSIDIVPKQQWWTHLTADDRKSTALDAVLPTVETLVMCGERAIDYDDTNARRLLQPRGIQCPPLDRDLITSLISHLRINGHIEHVEPTPTRR